MKLRNTIRISARRSAVLTFCAVALFPGVLLQGCTGGKQPEPPPAPEPEGYRGPVPIDLVVQSVPSGANVNFSTGEKCVTPCTINKQSNEGFTVTVSKPNYKSATVKVTSNIQSLIEYNRRTGTPEDVLNKLRVQNEKLVPNPVTVTLDPEWSR